MTDAEYTYSSEEENENERDRKSGSENQTQEQERKRKQRRDPKSTRDEATQTCDYRFDPPPDSSIDEPWSCPHAAHDDGRCPFHMSPSERDARGIVADDLRNAFLAALESGDPARKRFVGAQFPRLDLSYLDLEFDCQRPIDLRYAEIEGALEATFARFEERLDLRYATVGGLALENADFEDGVLCTGATITGPVDGFELTVTGDDADFEDAQFEHRVRFDEATFEDDATFDGATFEEQASFLGTTFTGRSNEIDDNVSFEGTVFEARASFRYANVEHASFDGARFTDIADFEGVTATGAITFVDVGFDGETDFDEARFHDDADFGGVIFRGDTHFRGAEFDGGAAVLRDDATFSDVVFEGPVNFERVTFGLTTFDDTVFEASATFELATFEDDATFRNATFDDEADFDEVVFDGDADFEAATLSGPATFRGAEFTGRSNHHDESVSFRAATFSDDADFHDVTCTTASFRETRFAGTVVFVDAEFGTIDCNIVSVGRDTYVDFTGAVIGEGTIEQPADGWVRYDLTEATVGDVALRAATPEDERRLLEYVRFCNTTFDGFDFSDHTASLDRNDWALHTFDGARDVDHEFALEMTPATIEKTYLRAKTSASAESNVKAAGEFRVKRQSFARKKYLEIARDRTEDRMVRLQNALRAAENYFLGVTCGYGMRLYRIAAAFLLWPLIPAFLYAFGGPAFETDGIEQLNGLSHLATPEGAEIFYHNLYFSYITFLTIGYGDHFPSGRLAQLLAGFEVYVSIVLGGLFIYALVKRSEV